MRCYAGIGSRRAPDHVLGLCTRLGVKMCQHGWVLRSGHAIGCDQAFEAGAYSPDRVRAQIFLPWKDYESEIPATGQVQRVPVTAAIHLVARYHPTPERLSRAAVRLHARNCHILLGPALDDPVDRVICWTRNEARGGTAFGIRVARELGIPVHNLADEDVRSAYLALCDGRVDDPPPRLVD